MLRKTISFTDYNGQQRKQDFYFHFAQSELIEWEASKRGGLTTILKRIVDEDDRPKIMEYFKEIILKAYGEKSDDGLHFFKSPEISDRFAHTPAYDALFMEIITNEDTMSNFVNTLVHPPASAPQTEEPGRVSALNALG